MLTKIWSKLIEITDFRAWAVFFTLGIVAFIIISLPRLDVVWSILAPDFSRDARYQMQGIFLPDRDQEVDLIIAGDAIFQASFLENKAPILPKANSIIINDYEADDAGDVLNNIWNGERVTDTRVCAIVIQISPNFSTRMRAMGSPQVSNLLSTYKKRRKLHDRLGDIFRIIEAWIKTQDTIDDLYTNAGRIATHIGQARFADPGNENWNRAFKRLSQISGHVIGVFDTRGTEWGDDSDLIVHTRMLLKNLSESAENFDWVELEEISTITPQVCN